MSARVKLGAWTRMNWMTAFYNYILERFTYILEYGNVRRHLSNLFSCVLYASSDQVSGNEYRYITNYQIDAW